MEQQEVSGENERKRALIALVMALTHRQKKRRVVVQALVSILASDESHSSGAVTMVVNRAEDALYEASVLSAIPLLASMRADRTRRSSVPFFEDMVAEEHVFYARYRMPKKLFASMSRRLLPYVITGHALTARRFLIHESREVYTSMIFGCLLLYLSTPGQQRSLGDHFGVSQSCVSKWLRRGVRALLRVHGDKGTHPMVTLPSLSHFIENVEPYFYKATGVHYIGLIADGFHVAIEAPPHSQHQTEDFLCRKKGYLHSLNCLILCDHRKYICFAEPKWPGSVNDRGMTGRSKKLRELLVHPACPSFPEPLHVLADSGFIMRKYFMMPFSDEYHDGAEHPVLTSANKKAFNHAICSQRVIVEQAIGLLKGKWQRLKNFRIHETTSFVPLVVKCSIILHNICILNHAFTDAEVECGSLAEEAEPDRSGVDDARNWDEVDSRDVASAREEYKQRQIKVLQLWLQERDGYEPTLEDLRDIHGCMAYV